MGATDNAVTEKGLYTDAKNRSSWSSEPVLLLKHHASCSGVLDATLNVLSMSFTPNTF